jgi:hypothetical protein
VLVPPCTLSTKVGRKGGIFMSMDMQDPDNRVDALVALVDRRRLLLAGGGAALAAALGGSGSLAGTARAAKRTGRVFKPEIVTVSYVASGRKYEGRFVGSQPRADLSFTENGVLLLRSQALSVASKDLSVQALFHGALGSGVDHAIAVESTSFIRPGWAVSGVPIAIRSGRQTWGGTYDFHSAKVTGLEKAPKLHDVLPADVMTKITPLLVKLQPYAKPYVSRLLTLGPVGRPVPTPSNGPVYQVITGTPKPKAVDPHMWDIGGGILGNLTNWYDHGGCQNACWGVAGGAVAGCGIAGFGFGAVFCGLAIGWLANQCSQNCPH